MTSARMNRTLHSVKNNSARLLLCASIGATPLAHAAAAQNDPHAHHHIPEPIPAVDEHAQHAQATTPEPTDEHAGHDMAAVPLPPDDGNRDPHAYAAGYTSGIGPYALAGGHAAHMNAYLYSGAFLIDQLETAKINHTQTSSYKMEAWYGRDFHRLLLRSEGRHSEGGTIKTHTDLMLSSAISTYWDALAGLRIDSGTGQGDGTRSWLGAGIRGLAPYWIELAFSAYAGERGQTALIAEAEYDTRLSQQLVMQSNVELSFHGQDELLHHESKGLSDALLGLRLRYEFTPKFAPYIGIESSRYFGSIIDVRRQQGLPTRDTRYVFGLSFWF
jgi:copper resistance protein B